MPQPVSSGPLSSRMVSSPAPAARWTRARLPLPSFPISGFTSATCGGFASTGATSCRTHRRHARRRSRNGSKGPLSTRPTTGHSRRRRGEESSARPDIRHHRAHRQRCVLSRMHCDQRGPAAGGRRCGDRRPVTGLEDRPLPQRNVPRVRRNRPGVRDRPASPQIAHTARFSRMRGNDPGSGSLCPACPPRVLQTEVVV